MEFNQNSTINSADNLLSKNTLTDACNTAYPSFAGAADYHFQQSYCGTKQQCSPHFQAPVKAKYRSVQNCIMLQSKASEYRNDAETRIQWSWRSGFISFRFQNLKNAAECWQGFIKSHHCVCEWFPFGRILACSLTASAYYINWIPLVLAGSGLFR